MVTKQQMLDAAARSGLGDQRQLSTTFVNFQKRGLLGKSIGRASGQRTGPGRWHDAQAGLWIALLRHRAAGVQLTTLANLPVGGWLLGEPGIELAQVQLAFGVWLDAEHRTSRPTGTRSLHTRARRAQVEWFAAPDASPAAKRQLRDVLDLAQRTTPDPAPSRETLMRHALEAINADPQASDAQRLHARSVPLAIRYQATTVRNARLLSTSRADVMEFWEWTRKTMQTGLAGYQDYQPTQRADVKIGDAYEPASVNSVIQTACSSLAIALGGGLDALERNRPIPGLGMPPLLALRSRRD